MIIQKSITEILDDFPLNQAMCACNDFYPSRIQYESIYYENTFEDLSFAVSLDGKNLAAIMVTLKNGLLSFFSAPLEIIYHPELTKEEKFHLEDYLRTFFEALIAKKKIEKIIFKPHAFLADLFLTNITEQNGKFVSLVDLTQSEDLIKKNIRKRYRSFINWGARELKLTFVDRANPDRNLFESFRQFHIQVSGRETRSVETWSKQMDMIQSGEAFLILGHIGNSLVSSLLCACGSEEAYYWVGVSDRELMAENKPLLHYLIYQAIMRTKEMGLKSFNLGEVKSELFSEKEKAIANFKKGFSSTVSLRPYLVAEFGHEE